MWIGALVARAAGAGEILREYQKTYHPERFYTLKIGIPWVDVENKLSTHQVLALCGDSGLLDRSDRSCTMGIDTGKDLHVVISRRKDPKGESITREVVWIGTVQSYEELDSLMDRYHISRCVIDAMPEIHATRQFAKRHGGRVWLCYFNENQKGSAKWDQEQHIVQVNRTEALDAGKKGIRDAEVILPRRIPVVQTFAEHLASDAKQLIEDEETGAKSYRYIRTGTNHYSLAFCYDWLASENDRVSYGGIVEVGDWGGTIMGGFIRAMRNEGAEWPPRWDRNRVF